ncbi:MAG: L-dopachrome tautomerase-related protein [Alphaproteobacteria bacterium]|nr:L-dopachrome tautomerase-related protein [Alphaproteobacteria bacterium]
MRVSLMMGLMVGVCVMGFTPMTMAAGEATKVEQSSKAVEAPKLEKVAELEGRPANLAVSVDGQIVVSMHPFDKPATKMILIKKDGTTEPFPSAKWNEGDGPDANGIGFTNVMGVRASTNGTVVVLDMGNEDHAPRLVELNLRGQVIVSVRYIPRDFTTEQSFLQDFAYDWDKGHIYIADMGQADLTKPAKPAIIDVDMRGGWIHRTFTNFPGIMPPEEPVKVNGKVLTIDKDGKEVPVHAALNSITIDVLQDYLYFAPMGAGKLYRVPLSRLSDIAFSEEDVIKRVEVIGDKPESDGITVDSAGNVYIAAFGKGEIGVMSPDGVYKTYIKDDRLQWADGFSFAPDGYIYVTISRLNEAPIFNHGKEPAEKKPYLIARFKPITDGGIGR